MTVGELIARLERFDKDLLVMTDFHDVFTPAELPYITKVRLDFDIEYTKVVII